MSIIYRALQELQNEDSINAVSSEVSHAKTPENREKKTFLWWAIGMLILSVVVFWLFNLGTIKDQTMELNRVKNNSQNVVMVEQNILQTQISVANDSTENSLASNAKKLMVKKVTEASVKQSSLIKAKTEVNANPLRLNTHKVSLPVVISKAIVSKAEVQPKVILPINSEKQSINKSELASTSKQPIKIENEKKVLPIIHSQKISLSSQEIARLRVNLIQNIKRKKFEESGKILKELKSALGNESPFILKLEAYLQMKKGNNQLALEQYQDLFAADTSDSDSLLNIVIIEIQLERYDDAVKRLEVLVDRTGYEDKSRRLLEYLRQISLTKIKIS